MLTARQVIEGLNQNVPHAQLTLMAFVDAFRRADVNTKQRMLEEAPAELTGRNEGLVAAVASALCRETEMTPTDWVGKTSSREPYFLPNAKSTALRARLMLESPPPFKIRNIFVPENFLHRA